MAQASPGQVTSMPGVAPGTQEHLDEDAGDPRSGLLLLRGLRRTERSLNH